MAALAALTSTVSYIDRQTFSVLAPKICEALHISETGYGVLTSAFAVAYLVSTPLSGWWLDRVGARRGLVGSVLVWSVIAALHALVPGFAVMFAFRIALGLAEGPSFPGAAQTIQRVLPSGSRSRGFGLLFTGSSIGGMIVPPLAAWLYATAHSWRVAFLGTAVAGLLWVPAWIALTRRADVREILDARAPDAAPRPRWRTVARDPAMIRGLVAVFATAPISLFAQIWGAKYLVRTFHVAQENVGHYLWLPPLLFDAGALLFGDLAARFPRRVRVTYGVALLLALVIALLPSVHGEWQAMAVLGIASAGGGGMYVVCTADLLSRVAPNAISLAGGTLAGAQSLSMIVAGPLVGAAVGHFASYSQVALVLAPIVATGAIAWIVSGARR
jgi:ACS family hexuronate transporter-like MFS transporter